jgi:hypothetical protein
MPKTLPFARRPNSARARRAKTMLLPMPRATADDLALRVQLALATMWAGAGSARDAQTLTQTMILTAARRCGLSRKRASGSTASRQASPTSEQTASWPEPAGSVRSPSSPGREGGTGAARTVVSLSPPRPEQPYKLFA